MSKHSGADWLETERKYWKGQNHPISDLGHDVADILGQAYCGLYHMDAKLENADWSDNYCISVTVRNSGSDLATYDSSILADLVLMCFLLNIRFAVKAVSNGYIRLIFMRVNHRGFFREGHPFLDEAVKKSQADVEAILSSRHVEVKGAIPDSDEYLESMHEGMETNG